MPILDEDVVATKAATDIVAVVSEYLQLRKVGRSFVGLCPFHNEKTPSFSVSPEGFYNCFGCQKGGDAITFVREIEGLDFAAAVEALARKAGITLRYSDPDEFEHRKTRNQLGEAMRAAVDWYHERLLRAPDAAAARAYLRSRGFDGDLVRRFELGWAPDGWDEAVRALGLDRRRAVDSGLAFVNRAGRLQDFFRGRVLFPIFDVAGSPVGFGGRLLPGASGPKYLNPTQTPLYDKSRILYGLNWAKQDAVQVGEVVVCEGYTDVIGYHTAGVARAVATCGTALTEDHVRVLTRFARRVVLSFDADAAGQAAADRFHEWEDRHQLDVRVAELPPGADPGELARNDPAGLASAVSEAAPYLAFRIERVLAAGSLDSAEGRARAAQAAVAVLAAHPSALVRDQYALDVAARCRIEVEALRSVLADELGRRARRPRSEVAEARSGRSRPVAAAGGRPRVTAGAGSLVAGAAQGAGGESTGWAADDPTDPGPTDEGWWAEPALPGQPGSPDRGGASFPPVRGAERAALSLASADLALVEDWFDPVLFGHPIARAAADALRNAKSIMEAAERADDHVASLLRQVASEDTDTDPEEVFVRLAQEAASRETRRVAAELRLAADPLSSAPIVRQLSDWKSTLFDDGVALAARRDVGIELLTWLLDLPEERG
ncbi:MAG: DNA primase [Acidimicrobiia bacterium]|nr:DNA primase [Acidimicrobiia bacterium]